LGFGVWGLELGMQGRPKILGLVVGLEFRVYNPGFMGFRVYRVRFSV
jgi:hypothetical protein